ncbi:MAG: glycosyltransferase family 4 protein [Candidatus Magasanikbacteria bacterium]|nr:glycosyltransferase family 4 protein [Candidatus Magasanikbacteria bacterium]
MSKKTKILHIIPIFATGGAEKLVLQYAKMFDPKKYEVHVASCVEDGELRTEFEKLAHVHIFVGSRTADGGRRAVYARLEKYVEEIKPDIIHTHMLSADWAGFVFRRKYGKNIKWVSTMHNVETATSWWRQMLWKYILKRADKVISVSQKVEDFVLDNFGIQRNKSVVLQNGIELTKWIKVSTDGLFSKKKLRIACVGRFWEQKGHIYLLQACALLGDLEYELHLFGGGPLEENLKKEAQRLGIQQNVVWHGMVSDVERYMADIDIVAQPSLWEGLSLVVMEVMAAGRPVIATPVAGAELIDDTKNGYIVPAKNPQALAEKIHYVSQHREEALRVALPARTYATSHFDIVQNVQSLEGIYSQLKKYE